MTHTPLSHIPTHHIPTCPLDLFDEDSEIWACPSCQNVFKDPLTFISPYDNQERCVKCASAHSREIHRTEKRLPPSAHAGRDTALRGSNLNQGA